ncbi:metal-sulfur cluster assembly factor [Calidifontimicrobium sp. SYSU G02091]|uniref:metal-sulfur cluster assembly factor n=1 Tax=Calidifontimicrobium sp. SYSU G02091 TaxID=2926421 RepID=UPI001F530E68|nr:metal-sulfur cluster assembly factor [Calidifontimicrobium sp. SYSU G02091]MCI1190937.1 metal-sulfur cluster assembly factor [Calidifontimicrobium sp. SYSU G02091]
MPPNEPPDADLPPLDAAAVRAALRDVRDPEIGESVVDLGLVASVSVDTGVLRVTLIPTSATCPLADVLLEDVETALRRLCVGRGLDIAVVMDWQQTWDPERLSPALKARFGW